MRVGRDQAWRGLLADGVEELGDDLRVGDSAAERWGWLAGAALGAQLTDRNGAPRRARPQSVLEGAGPGGAGPTVSLRRGDEDTQPNGVLWCFNAIRSLTKAPKHKGMIGR